MKMLILQIIPDAGQEEDEGKDAGESEGDVFEIDSVLVVEEGQGPLSSPPILAHFAFHFLSYYPCYVCVCVL